jgi:hypothetical protein
MMLLLGILAAVPALAGSAVIGSVAGSMNATLAGQPLLPSTTIVSGDSLEVNDGAAVVAIDDTSRMVFGRQTTASFLRDAHEVTVMLTRGSLSMFHPQDGVALRVRVGNVSVVPVSGFKTLGEVAMAGGSLVVSAKEGSFRVERGGSALEVAKGKTITLPTEAARAATPGSAKPVAGLVSGLGLQVASLGAAGTGAVLSGVAVSHANSARDQATLADTDAKAATAAAQAANTAATSANTAAQAATTAAAGNATAINSVGCALDKVTPSVTIGGKLVSPYTPPTGSTC